MSDYFEHQDPFFEDLSPVKPIPKRIKQKPNIKNNIQKLERQIKTYESKIQTLKLRIKQLQRLRAKTKQ